MKHDGKRILGGGLLLLLLAACGGGGGDSDAPAAGTGSSGTGSTSTGQGSTGGAAGGTGGTAGSTDSATNRFTGKATWTVQVPAAGSSVCYDFDKAVEVAGCAGNAWDLKLTTGSGRSGTSLFTNSGPSGSGNGGVNIGTGAGMPTWTYLQTWKNALTEPGANQALPDRIYFPDSTVGAFSGTNEIGSAAFEYSLGGTHKMFPNYRVFLVSTDSSSNSTTGTATAPVYALQVVGFYGGASGDVSGYPAFRWVNRAEAGSAVRTAQVDARDQGKWVYFNLASGTEVAESGEWHVAFSRYRIRLNPAGGKLGAAVGLTPDGLYDADGKVQSAAMMAATPESTLASLTAAAIPATAEWRKDGDSSRLNLATSKRNDNGSFDYGWYTYYPTADLANAAGLGATAHVIGANADKGRLIRGGEGNSYARFHLTKVQYQDAANPRSPQTWTVEFEVQPAAQ